MLLIKKCNDFQVLQRYCKGIEKIPNKAFSGCSIVFDQFLFFLGDGPSKGRSPVEWGRFSVRMYVHPYVRTISALFFPIFRTIYSPTVFTVRRQKWKQRIPCELETISKMESISI